MRVRSCGNAQAFTSGAREARSAEAGRPRGARARFPPSQPDTAMRPASLPTWGAFPWPAEGLPIQRAIQSTGIRIAEIACGENLLRNSSTIAQNIAELHTRDHGQVSDRLSKILRNPLIG